MTTVGEIYVHVRKFMHGCVFCRTHTLRCEIYFKIQNINYNFFYLCLPENEIPAPIKCLWQKLPLLISFGLLSLSYSSTYWLIPKGFSSWVCNPWGFGSKSHVFPFMTLPENGKLKSWLCLDMCFLVSFHLLSDLPILHSFSYTLYSLWYYTTFTVHNVCFCN